MIITNKTYIFVVFAVFIVVTGAEDENVPFLVLKYGANFAEIQRNTALVLSQIQQNSSYIF